MFTNINVIKKGIRKQCYRSHPTMRIDDSSTRNDIAFENGNHHRIQSIGTDDSDEYRKLKIRFQISAKFTYLINRISNFLGFTTNRTRI